MASITSTQNHQNEQVATARYFSPINGPNQYFSILRLTRENQSLFVKTILDASKGSVLDHHLAYFLEAAAKVNSYATPLFFVRAFNPIFGDRPLFVFSLRQKNFGSSLEPELGFEFVSKILPPEKEPILFPIVKFSVQWVFSHLLPSVSENSLKGSAKKVREVSLYFQENFLPYFFGHLAGKHVLCEKSFAFWKIRISDLLPKAENPPPLEPPHSTVKIEEGSSKRPRN